MSIFEMIKSIAETQGNNAKMDLFKEYLAGPNGELLNEVFYAALSSEIRYYVRKVSFPSEFNQIISLSEAIETMYSQLATRNVTGNAAVALVEKLLESLTHDDAKVLHMILQSKLDCGISVTSANKAMKKKIPTFSVMLCGKSTEKNLAKMPQSNSSNTLIAQLKSDGLRVIISIDDKKSVKFRTRNGNEIELPDEISSQFSEHTGKVFDGEAIVVEDGKILPRKTGNGIINSVQQGDLTYVDKIQFVLWDVVPYDEFFIDGISKESYDNRWTQLCGMNLPSNCQLQQSRWVSSIDEAREYYNELLAAGEEGIILKDPKGKYETKRVNHQLKFKAEKEGDFKIVGFVEGTGKYTGSLGAIIIETSCGKLRTNVGTGLSDKDRSWIWQHKEKYLDMICVVYYNEIISSNGKDTYSLFLPVFGEVRTDKNEANTLKELS
jgi:ATP-dependent DNA ligase